MKVIVVGAGLACAKALMRGGVEPHLYLAGEYTEGSSINGSMFSGEKAAGEVLG